MPRELPVTNAPLPFSRPIAYNFFVIRRLTGHDARRCRVIHSLAWPVMNLRTSRLQWVIFDGLSSVCRLAMSVLPPN
jgi:hypothetical protein